MNRREFIKGAAGVCLSLFAEKGFGGETREEKIYIKEEASCPPASRPATPIGSRHEFPSSTLV